MKGTNCSVCENTMECKSADECINEAEPFCYNCNHFYGDDECNNCVYYEKEPKNHYGDGTCYYNGVFNCTGCGECND